jgi:dienelactone hydrolase
MPRSHGRIFSFFIIRALLIGPSERGVYIPQAGEGLNFGWRSKDKKEDSALSWDGSEGSYYTYASIAWSPDSKKLAAYRIRPGYHRFLQFIESSPADQLQPKYSTFEYAPYFNHYYRINLDGTGLIPLTEGNANHSVVFSEDRAFAVDTWSRIDQPPVMEVLKVGETKPVYRAEAADIQALVKTGWKAPEVFVAKARDGKTDIWGIITRPMSFNPARKYPVIENIYAGPHGSFVPKNFSPNVAMQSLAELGFIVIQVDGMGTSNRSKEFQDYCWKNIGDAGFPDRILWHKAAAAKYPYYDISRVGIYGTSAGGQNALGALLFHPEFYDAAFSACGCHDNRMDKIWWNEAWMGWPLGPEYAASSNVDNAWRLQGKLLLVVGEMDQNVDPASTYLVVNALIKANKVFDLLVIPGAGHTNGGPYGVRKMGDFFVHNLLGVEPPDWNKTEPVQPGEKK